MPTVSLTLLDPRTAEPGDLVRTLAAIHPQRVASAAEDQPQEPPETFALWRAHVLAPWSGDPQRLLVAHDSDGAPLGHAVVELPSHDNPHAGLVEFHVAREYRRHGVGRALWAAAVEHLRGEGRRTLIVEAREGSPMDAFAAAMGAQGKSVEVCRVQPIAGLDLADVATLRTDAARAASGYRLEAWSGPTPDRQIDAVAHVVHALNDAPMGDLDYDDEVWDAERLRKRDRFVIESRLRLHTILAVAPDGAPAGYTEVAVSEDGTFGWQWGTGVDAAHRGRRLGMLLKASMVERLRALEPRLGVVTTWNSEENGHMIAINERLGYVPVSRGVERQLELA